MTIRGWKTKFNEIRKDFGYSEKEDFHSAKKLNLLLIICTQAIRHKIGIKKGK